MNDMPELGDAAQDRTRKVSQSVKEDPIDADAHQKAQSVHAKHLRAHRQSCYPREFKPYCFKQYKARVGKSVKFQHSGGIQMPFTIDKNEIVNHNTCCAGGDELRNGRVHSVSLRESIEEHNGWDMLHLCDPTRNINNVGVGRGFIR